MKGKILVVDDEKSIRVTLEHFLSEEGYEVAVAEGYDDALAIILESQFDLIISDIILAEKSGIDLLRELTRNNINCPVVMITGAPDIHTATEALRLGAFDYISKPVRKESILHVTGIALKHKLLSDEKEKYRRHLETIFNNINEGIVTIDNDFHITGMNGAARMMCGFPDDVMTSKLNTLVTFCNGKCIDVLKESIQKKQTVETYRNECHHNKYAGKVVTISSSPLIDHQGLFSGAMLVIKDETRLDVLERDLQERKQVHNIIGQSKGMQGVYSLIDDLADVYSTVLITGETGTGKELVADALHYRGSRREAPLVKVNCSALQENLLESELFGHVKGAFTGAIDSKRGRFQKAEGGTIFLDEIGDISKIVQHKLLRVLQNREFERVGDSVPIKADVRVVTATNKDLRKKVSSGDFREDLYYRLKVIEVALPPLRERREDIPILVEHFINRFNKKMNREIDAVSDDVMNIFMDYHWPGNVRELEHTIEHAFIVCHSRTITLEYLPSEFENHLSISRPLLEEHDGDESKAILHALEKCGWNKSKAARLLGMSRPTIYRKIKELKLDRS
jgi:PAS domain S-box-containing protein